MNEEQEQFMFACCRKAKDEGLFVKQASDQDPNVAGLTVFRCPKCNRRHFEMDAEPGVIGLRGARM